MAIVRRKDSHGKVLKTGESQRKDGTYMYRYTDRNKARKTIYGKTLNDLRKKEEELNQNLALNIYSNEWTMNELFDKYMEQKSSILLKPRTKHKYIIEYDRWVRHTWFGNKKIKTIIKSDVVLFYKELKEKNGFSDGTIRCINKYISGALQMATEDDLIRRNYAESCINIYNKNNIRNALTKEETHLFLTACEEETSGKNYLLGFKLMLLSGMRFGEMAGLTWDNVDLKNRIINVNHQFIIGDENSRTAYHIDTPKTHSGNRKIPMSDDLYELFKELKRTTYFDAYKFNVEVDGCKGFVIHSRTGLPLLNNRFNEYAKKIVKKFNAIHEKQLPNITCHICRHTFCTRLAELKMNPSVLKTIMGHSSYRMTEEVYISVEDDFVNEEFFQIMRGKHVV